VQRGNIHGTTRLAAVLGWPSIHSASPALLILLRHVAHRRGACPMGVAPSTSPTHRRDFAPFRHSCELDRVRTRLAASPTCDDYPRLRAAILRGQSACTSTAISIVGPQNTPTPPGRGVASADALCLTLGDAGARGPARFRLLRHFAVPTGSPSPAAEGRGSSRAAARRGSWIDTRTSRLSCDRLRHALGHAIWSSMHAVGDRSATGRFVASLPLTSLQAGPRSHARPIPHYQPRVACARVWLSHPRRGPHARAQTHDLHDLDGVPGSIDAMTRALALLRTRRVNRE